MSGVILCGMKTKRGKCPTSVDGKCRKCKVPVEYSYGIAPGYGGIGSYTYCPECGMVYDYVKDDGS